MCRVGTTFGEKEGKYLLGLHMIVHFVFGIKISPARMERIAILAAFSTKIGCFGAVSIVVFLAAIFWWHFEIAGIDVRSKGYERVSIWVMIIV